MLKKDSLWLGFGIGLLVPALLFGLIYLVSLVTPLFSLDKAPFVCVALNIVPVRYYFITAKLEHTGRGILAMTVILAVLVILFRI